MFKKMKITVTARALCLIFAVISVFSLFSCSPNIKNDAYDVDLKEYIRVQDLSQVVISATELNTQVMNAFNAVLWNNNLFSAAAEGAQVQMYDKVTVDYDCIIEGLVINGFSKKDASIYIGSATMLEDIENGIIGMKAGETKSLNIRFPDEYYDGMEGIAATYVITVKSIQTLSAMTDEICKEYTDYNSVEELKAGLTSSISAELAFVKLYEESEVIKYPEAEYKVFFDDVSSMERYAEEKKKSLEDVIKEFGDQFSEYGMSSSMTVEEYRQFCKDYADSETKEEMLVYYILRELKVKTSGSVYEKAKKQLLRDHNMYDEIAYDGTYGQGAMVEAIRYNIMLQALAKVTVAA